MPDNVTLNGDIAVDTEAMGLNNHRDRLCVIQISDGNGDAHIVHFPEPKFDCPNLRKVLFDSKRCKIFHFGRFDISIMHYYLKEEMDNVFCTKIASRLVRTYTDHHGLKDLCNDLIGVKLNKQQQTSDWGAKELSDAQIEYAASDVLYLHKLRDRLTKLLERENRLDLANSCYQFLPTRANLDILGWPDVDIFHH